MGWSSVEQRRAYNRARYRAMRDGTWQHRRSTPELICPTCGRSFKRSPANRRAEVNYCSRACMAASFTGRPSPKRKERVSAPCLACGSIVTKPAWAMRQNDRTFCDRACFGVWKSANWTGNANPAWKGGHQPYYGANWKRQQREARRRDGHRCRFCGVAESTLRRALDVHHIRPFRFFGVENHRAANRLANLVSLCDRCHTYLERFCSDGTITDWPILLETGAGPLPPGAQGSLGS